MSENLRLIAQYAAMPQRGTMIPNRILLWLLKFMLRIAGLVFPYVILFILLISEYVRSRTFVVKNIRYNI